MDAKPEEHERPVCFVIMPISDVAGYDSGHFGRVYEHLLKPAIIEAGFRPVRSDDTTKTDYIVVGIVQRVVESPMVVCDFSARNPNVMYELGIRHAFNKPVALIKDTNTDKVFDIQGLRYTEYETALRIDTVQKDIAKIAAAIKNTAAANDGFNSVVQLAGLKTATVPEKQEVSPDTRLLLSAIAAIDRRLDAVDSRAKSIDRFFSIVDGAVRLGDGSQVRLGEEIYDGPGNLIGRLIDIHPADDRLFIRHKDGKVIPYYAFSIKSKDLTTVPF